MSAVECANIKTGLSEGILMNDPESSGSLLFSLYPYFII